MSYTIGSGAPEMLQSLVRRNSWLAADIETYGLGLRARDIKIVTFATPEHAVILDIRDPAQAEVIEWGFSEVDELIFHNSPYDVPNLAAAGHWRPEWCRKVTDTIIYARMAEPSVIRKKTVEACAARYLGWTNTGATMNKLFRELGMKISEGWERFDVDRPVYIYGAARDAITTARLLPLVREAAHNRITSGHPWVGNLYGVSGAEARRLVEREQVLNRGIFLPRSVKGLRIDPDWADVYQETHLAEQIHAREVLKSVGVEPNKATQLTGFLEGIGAIPEDYPTTEKTGAWSTTAENLARLHHPVAQAYISIKQTEHVQNDYLNKCLELELGGRVFPSVNMLAATTGRMSMGDPPLHQFPGDARGIILADEGDRMTSIDWSQIEPVLLANMARDLDVIHAYEDPTVKADMYLPIAEAASVSRTVAKVVLLAQLYGEGITALALDLGVSKEEAKRLREVVFGPIPKIKNLVRNMRGIAERHKMVFTLSGRILPIPADAKWGIHTHKGINYLNQGSAYDLLAEALVEVEAQGLGDAIYLALHDELVCSEDAAHDVRKIMEQPPNRLIEIAQRTPVLRTDLKNLGDRWADA
jgi:DNA polymerase-1